MSGIKPVRVPHLPKALFVPSPEKGPVPVCAIPAPSIARDPRSQAPHWYAPSWRGRDLNPRSRRGRDSNRGLSEAGTRTRGLSEAGIRTRGAGAARGPPGPEAERGSGAGSPRPPLGPARCSSPAPSALPPPRCASRSARSAPRPPAPCCLRPPPRPPWRARCGSWAALERGGRRCCGPAGARPAACPAAAAVCTPRVSPWEGAGRTRALHAPLHPGKHGGRGGLSLLPPLSLRQLHLSLIPVFPKPPISLNSIIA